MVNIIKNKILNQKIIKKTEEQISRIKAKILQSFFFNNLDQKDIDIVIDAMEERKYAPGETVITQGESGDCLFFIEKGELDCFKRFNQEKEDKLVRQYRDSESFGELALLYNAPRAATVKARTNSFLWSLDRETFNLIVKESTMKKEKNMKNSLVLWRFYQQLIITKRCKYVII